MPEKPSSSDYEAGKPFALVVPNYEELGMSGPYIGDKIWSYLQEKSDDFFDYVPANVSPFTDVSEKVVINRSVREKDVYVIHSLYLYPARHVWVGAQIGNAIKTAGDAKRANLFDFYNPYFRQDYKVGRESLTARMVGDLYHGNGIECVFTCDPHSYQLELAFNKLQSLRLSGKLARFFQENFDTSNCVVSPPDEGGYKRAKRFSRILGLPMIPLEKDRYGIDKVKMEHVPYGVEGRDIIIRDDILGTGGTLIAASRALQEHGARKIYACITHLGLYEDAKEQIKKSGIVVVGTNTIPQTFTEEDKEYFKVMDISPVIAEVIYRKANCMSISEFFKESIGI